MKKIEGITVSGSISLIDALKKMDEVGRKLLLVANGTKFVGVVSIGDLQRCILKCVDLNTEVRSIIRTDIIFASEGTPLESIKGQMLKWRMEFMPVVAGDGTVKDVIFWEDLFPSKMPAVKLEEKYPVVIMAGGFGTRLKPLTNVIPKPLVPIGEKTIIEYIIDSFEAVGCDEFYCSVNYKADILKYYLDGKGKRLTYFQENKPLGTAGSLYLLRDKLSGTFFVINCDILLDVDLSELIKFHKRNGYVITLVSVIKNVQIPYGILKTKQNGQLMGLEEKPNEVYQINSGLYVLEPEIFNYIEDNQFLHITTLVERLVADGRKVGVFPVNEHSWTDMGNWCEYLKLIEVQQGGQATPAISLSPVLRFK